jgi:hypothetical protein
MKKQLLSLVAASLVCVVKAQTVTPVVLSNQGGHSVVSGNSISWTIGEPVSETYSITSNIATMGFHQPEIGLVTMLSQQSGDPGGVLVYPNPVRDMLTVNFKGMEEGQYSLVLFDNLGKLISRSEAYITGSNQLVQLKINEVAAGNYFLQVENKNFNKTIKINKIN